MTLNKIVEELKLCVITTIVRLCEATYNTDLEKKTDKNRCQVLYWPFDDALPLTRLLMNGCALEKEDSWRTWLLYCCDCESYNAVALALIEGEMKCEHVVQFIKQK